MLYDLNNELQREDFKKRVNELYQKKVIVELTRKFPPRTCPQNKYLHLILSWWAVYYGCSKKHAKEHFFKIHCNEDLFVRQQKAKDGTPYNDIRSSSDLTTQEMTLAIQRFRDFCAYQGCYIPSPEEREYLLYVEREIEKQQEFLQNDN